MKKVWFITFSILVLAASTLFPIPAQNKVLQIDFGKYDEYAFTLYERTRRIPQKNKLTSAVSVKIDKDINCDYKFVLKMPDYVGTMQAWSMGEWVTLKQGKSMSQAISTRSENHLLKGKKYTIKGSFQAGEKGGYLRGVYKGASLPLGRYALLVYIDNTLLKTIKFKVHKQFHR